jgi:hypothetical protein
MWAFQWLHDARDELADLWLNAADRKAVTQAAYDAERELAQSPTARAQFIAEGLWRLDVPPIRIYFSLREADHIVEVVSVKPCPDDASRS